MSYPIDLKPCPCCGAEPWVSFHPLPYRSGAWHIACKNEQCEKQPSTWFYYKKSDAIAEWNDLVKGVDE